MIYDKDINEILNNRYIRYRSEAMLNAQLNVERAEKLPEYSDITDKLRGFSFEIAKANANGETKKVEKLKKERSVLQDKQSEILKKIGFTKEDLLPKYRCKTCNDTGFVNGIACKCRYKELNDVVLKDLGISDYDLPSFSDSTLDNLPQLSTIYKLATDYVDKFDTTTIKNLLFTGKSGTGKTYLAGAIVNELNKREQVNVFIHSYDLFRVLLNKNKFDSSNQYVYDLLINCDLLVIDDLGTEPKTDAFLYGLNLIINQRYSLGNAFIITTNLSLTELNQRYGERIFSRITGKNTAVIPFNGDDLRKK